MANELNKISALDLSNVATCRIENTPLLTKNYKILKAYLLALNEKTRVRLIGIDTKIDTKDELNGFFDLLDTFRGIDQNNVNVDKAQVEGEIEIINAVAEHTLDVIRMRYPYIRLICTAQRIRTYFKNYNGTIDLYYDLLPAGEDAVYVGNTPTKPNDGDTYYSFVGWSSTMDSTEPDAVMTNITLAKVFYPAFKDSYMVTYMSYDGTTVLGRTITIEGQTSSFEGDESLTERDGYAFQGWNLEMNQEDAEEGALDDINGPRTVYAAYTPILTIQFMDDLGINVIQEVKTTKDVPFTFNETTPLTDRFEQDKYTFIGWNTERQAETPLDNMYAYMEPYNANSNMVIYPVFADTYTASMNYYVYVGRADYGSYDKYVYKLDLKNRTGTYLGGNGSSAGGSDGSVSGYPSYFILLKEGYSSISSVSEYWGGTYDYTSIEDAIKYTEEKSLLIKNPNYLTYGIANKRLNGNSSNPYSNYLCFITPDNKLTLKEPEAEDPEIEESE